MDIKIKINKQVLISCSLKDLKKRIGLGYYIVNKTISYNNKQIKLVCWGDSYRDHYDNIRVYNIEKKNAVRVRDENGHYKKIANASYTAYVYDIPVELLKLAGLSVEQKTRNFVLTQAK